VYLLNLYGGPILKHTTWKLCLLTLCLAALAAFATAPAAEAECSSPSSLSLAPGPGSFMVNVSGLAFATYQAGVTQSGSMQLGNLSIFPQSFNGTGASLSVGFSVPSVAPGTQATVTVQVSNGLGQIICRRSVVVTAKRSGTFGVEYQAHTGGYGWLGWVADGTTAGTTFQSLRMEAAQIRLVGAPFGMGICYSAHVEVYGWLGAVCNGATGGTTGQSLQMEAIRINLYGTPPGCSVEYRAHIRSYGWLPWVSNNAIAGSVGQGLRMEALEVRLAGCP
jgi:Clostridial hydrophobic W